MLSIIQGEATQPGSVSQDESGTVDNPAYGSDESKNDEHDPNAEEGGDNVQENEYYKDRASENYESDPNEEDDEDEEEDEMGGNDVQEHDERLYTKFPVPWWVQESFGDAPENVGERINGSSGNHEDRRST